MRPDRAPAPRSRAPFKSSCARAGRGADFRGSIDLLGQRSAALDPALAGRRGDARKRGEDTFPATLGAKLSMAASALRAERPRLAMAPGFAQSWKPTQSSMPSNTSRSRPGGAALKVRACGNSPSNHAAKRRTSPALWKATMSS